MDYLSKSDIVAKEIRDLIQRKELRPGEVLRQRDLAQRFGVSPTPVREALRRLEAEGYIVSELHRGATVVRTEKARITENFLVRAALEGLATEFAVKKISDQDLQMLEKLNQEMSECSSSDPKRLELNRRFHFRIYQAADSPILISLLTLLWRSLNEAPGAGRPLDESVSQHDRIIAALRDRDSEKAVMAVREHIEGWLPHAVEEGSTNMSA